jgi:hypothetical protein
MKYVAFLGAVVLLFASAARAQVNSGSSLLFGSPRPAFALPAADPEPAPQGVYGVLLNYSWQAYAGFQHISFYELPGITGQLNGFNLSLTYYPKGGHWAGEGEFATAFAPQGGVSTRLSMAFGGVRYRVDTGRGLEIWGHAMVGGAHFSPQTAFGSQDAAAFDVGGGVDLNPRHKRLGFRAQVDASPTLFFGTHQYNIRESVGIVYHF